MNLHHSAAQVPVFRRRHAGDHLNRFDIVHRYAPGIHSAEFGKGSVVAHTHSVNLHRRGESGITRRRAGRTHGKSR